MGFFYISLGSALFIRGPLICVCSSMMHEARHRSSFPLFYIISDMSGMSSLRYQLEHSWHHNWPNCPAGEIEQSFAYAPGMRHFTWQPRRFYHRLQWLYWPLSFCLVLLQVAVTDVTGFLVKGKMGALTRSNWTFRELMIFTFGKIMLIVSFVWPFISWAAGLHDLNLDNYIGYLIVFFANWFSCSFWLTLINVSTFDNGRARGQGCSGYRFCEDPDCSQQDLLCGQQVHDLGDIRHEHTNRAPFVPNSAIPIFARYHTRDPGGVRKAQCQFPCPVRFFLDCV